MKLCISQATTLPHAFAEDIAGYADGGCSAVEVWLTKLENHLQQQSIDSTRKLLAERGIALAAAAYQGGVLLSQGEARRAALDLLQSRLLLCRELAIPTLVLVADFTQAADPESLGRSVVSLIQAAQLASEAGVQLALEFRGVGTFCTCLDTALALVEECGQPNLGICLDWFHFFKGPSKESDLARLTRQNLAHVQVCDVPGIPRELMSDADRVFPGEGDLDLGPLVRRLKEIDYDRWISLELFNPTVGKAKPSQVAELGSAALERTFGTPHGISRTWLAGGH